MNLLYVFSLTKFNNMHIGIVIINKIIAYTKIGIKIKFDNFINLTSRIKIYFFIPEKSDIR